MDFLIFLLVNAVLFIRPEELWPEWSGAQFYNYLIIANLLVAGPQIINLFQGRNLVESPVTVCVLGVLAFIFISHVAQFNFWSARMGAFEFSKVVAYYLLLVAVLSTPRRLFMFLAAIALFTVVLTLLAVLQFHALINLPALAAVIEHAYDPLTGEKDTILRLRATGIFNDPNDLSMIIVASLAICTFGLFSPNLGPLRPLLLAPLGFLGYALALTGSRGGLLALMAAVVSLLYAKFGWKKAALAAAAALPGLLLVFRGRQADLGGAITGGTGRTRAELWSEALQFFKQSPVFGMGHGMFVEEVRQVVHNSFMHSFAELGFFGGALFLGIFLAAAAAVWRLHQVQDEIELPALARLQPYLLALVVAYGVSMLSLSRSYVVPTYLVAGLAVAYDRLARPGTSLVPAEFNGRLMKWLAIAGVAFIAAVYFYIKFYIRML